VTRTYYDMEVDPDDVWRALRKSRQSPPGAASESYEGNIDPKSRSLTPEGAARVGTYRAALEQAEQLMKAAAATGPAAQPLPLFYALSQFGRAIAAAAPVLSTSTREFKLNGHGVQATNLDSADRDGVAAVTVAGLPPVRRGRKQDGAFVKVAKALRASPMRETRSLGQILGRIPHSEGFGLTGQEHSPEPILTLTSIYPAMEGEQVVTIRGLPFDLLAGEPSPNNPGGAVPRPLEPDDQQVADTLSTYPSLRGWKWLESPIPVRVNPNGLGSWDANVCFPTTAGRSAVRDHATLYRGEFFAFPSVEDGLPVHPFLAWWQVLISLSMLARYQPNEWFTLIDVDRHEDAVPIESMLTFCQNALPDLALRAIEDASSKLLLTT
jgi:hypothetical protein